MPRKVALGEKPFTSIFGSMGSVFFGTIYVNNFNGLGDKLTVGSHFCADGVIIVALLDNCNTLRSFLDDYAKIASPKI